MNLSDPLSSVLSDNDAAVLRVVSRFEGQATGRRIQLLAGRPYSSTRLALARLTEVGLLDAVVLDHATLYSLNQEHLLWPALDEIAHARQTLVKKIRAFLGFPVDINEASTTLSVSFFGSVARRDSTAASDIDLAVLYSDEGQRSETADRVLLLQAKMQQWTGNTVQLYDITREDLKTMARNKDPLVASWVVDSDPILGPSISDLVRQLT